jgi:predicted acetyltransferase
MQAPPHLFPYRSVQDGLTLRLAASREDVEKALDAHVAAFGEEERLLLQIKLFDRPGRRPDQVILVEDAQAGQVASSVSLVEQTWTYEGIPIHVGEVGIVSTRPEYRRRGLVRTQFDIYHRMARRAGCLLSVISGIAYYYRQYGYEYIIATGGGLRLLSEQILLPPEGETSSYQVRRAMPEDWPQVLAFYRTSVQELCLAAVATDSIWHHQHSMPAEVSELKETYLVERDGQPCGYLRLNANELGWDKGVVISAAYLPGQEMCLSALRFARALADQRQQHTITVGIPLSIPLVQLARDLGGEPCDGYAWQVRVLDAVRFLLTIAPALERRLAQSAFAGLDDTIMLNLYREALVLRFRGGRLLSVSTTHDGEHADMSCPPAVAPMCWLGYRSVDEVVSWYPDASCRNRQRQRLLDALFPKRASFVLSQL